MAERFRILHCLRAPVGGLFRHVLDLSSAQADLGHDVGILASSSFGDALTTARFDKVRGKLALGISELPISRQPGLSDLAGWRETHSLARRLGVDVLHGHGAKGGALARLAGFSLRRAGRRVATVYTPHGGSLHFDPATLRGTAVLASERLLERLTDVVIFESAYAARVYEERVGPLAGAPIVIPNGLQPADFVPVTPRAGAADFLFVGELRHLKGVDVLIEALARVRRARDIRAVIVGAGPAAAEFKQLAKDRGIADIAQFPGAMPAREAFALGRCLVVPSRAESLPYVVLEAAAAGLPLIATNVGGIPEIVAGTRHALVPPGDATALAAALEDFMANTEAAKANAAALNKRVAERFTVAAMTRGVLDVYSKVIVP